MQITARQILGNTPTPIAHPRSQELHDLGVIRTAAALPGQAAFG
jgi:hypothetical protein